jgi:hypothetical protein
LLPIRQAVQILRERGKRAHVFSAARSGGTATKISVAPISIPAASGRITGSTALLALLFLLFFLAISSEHETWNQAGYRA